MLPRVPFSALWCDIQHPNPDNQKTETRAGRLRPSMQSLSDREPSGTYPAALVLESILTCAACAHAPVERMPVDRCCG